MAFSRVTTIWALVILAILVSSNNVIAQSPMTAPVEAPGPAGADCMTLIYNMTDCLTYVSKGSKTAKPDKACCPELAGMLDSNPICLCQMLGNSKALPIELDVSKALKLPNVCGLQTPPLSLCSAVGIPVGGPVGAPTSYAPSSSVAEVPVGAPTSSGGISPTAGEPSAGKNGASNAYFNRVYLVAGLAVALTLFTL